MLFLDIHRPRKIFLYLLIVFNVIFFSSILLVNGYPQTNDILHILKIANLEGNLKFINGIYGPGYTYLTLIFSNSLTVLTVLISFLYILSNILICSLLDFFTKNKIKDEQFSIYLITLLFHLIIITTLGLNHSDSLFLLLFYNGTLIFILGYYFKKNQIYMLGLLLVGISILFRHQGPIFLFFLSIFFLMFEKWQCKKNLTLFAKRYIKIFFILSIPIIISQIHLSSIEAVAEWQTRFKLHFFVHGDLWGDWRDLKYILESRQYNDFNIFEVDLNHLLKIIFNHLYGALRILYPFIIIFLIVFYISKKKIIFFSLCLFLAYILIVLPGYHRGYYPGILISFLSVLICFKEITERKIASLFIFIFLFGHLIYVTEKYASNMIYIYKINNDIKNNIAPLLNEKKIKYQNIFSDDYNFYTTKLDGDITRLCNWGGWFLNHPYLKNYYPREVILGKKNAYCDIKVFITREKEISEKYFLTGKFDKIYKTEMYYLLFKN
tara:strand:- start:672 stop:2153 length:1482 start_codon:yes stop_codon:yes gene_type:complete